MELQVMTELGSVFQAMENKIVPVVCILQVLEQNFLLAVSSTRVGTVFVVSSEPRKL
jgi:hypothetical protein